MRPNMKLRLGFLTVLVSLLMVMSISCYSQDEKISPRIDVTYYQSAVDVPYVMVRVRKRVERRYEPIAGIPVTIYFNEESEAAKAGTVTTNTKGTGKLSLPESMKSAWDSLQEFELFASVSASDSMEEASESIAIKRGRVRLVTKGSAGADRSVEVIVEEKSVDGWRPVQGAEVKVFVQRYFGRLTVGDDFYTSDETGLVEVAYDEDLAGDKERMITLGGMVEDSDDYGNLMGYASVKWGIPLQDDDSFMGRSLWATRDKTPWWLLIFPNLIILGVWGVIAFLIGQIVKLKKLARHHSQ